MFFEFTPRNRLTQGLYKVFLNKKAYGLGPKNVVNKLKKDESQYQTLIMSMTSVHLKPVQKKFTESLNELRPHPYQGSLNEMQMSEPKKKQLYSHPEIMARRTQENFGRHPHSKESPQ